MMIGGKRQQFYSDNLLVKIDPDLRAQLAAAAKRERMSMSELVRRGALPSPDMLSNPRPKPDGEMTEQPQHVQPAAALRFSSIGRALGS